MKWIFGYEIFLCSYRCRLFCIKLAKLYDVTIDNLVNYDEKEAGISVPPKGKHFFGATTVGERGQIVKNS